MTATTSPDLSFESWRRMCREYPDLERDELNERAHGYWAGMMRTQSPWLAGWPESRVAVLAATYATLDEKIENALARLFNDEERAAYEAQLELDGVSDRDDREELGLPARQIGGAQ